MSIEAQRAAVSAHAKVLGAIIEGEYLEVEEGRQKDRPELAKVVSHAKRTKAINTFPVSVEPLLVQNAAA